MLDKLNSRNAEKLELNEFKLNSLLEIVLMTVSDRVSPEANCIISNP